MNMHLNPLIILKFGILLIVSLLFLMIFHFFIGFLGIKFYFGTIIALFITFICILFKFAMPVIIFSFLGMINVLEWHWSIAFIISIPSLFFITPSKFRTTFNSKTFRSGYNFRYYNRDFNSKDSTIKTNVTNNDIIDGDYKIIKDKNDKD